MTAITLAAVYEQDFDAWLQGTVELLRQGRFAEIDVEHVVVELAEMGKRDRRELESHLRILMAHLLKWQWQPERRCGSWRGSIVEQRLQLAKQLADSPGLKTYQLQVVEVAYVDAVAIASAETGLPMAAFPAICPFQLADLQDARYYPE